MVIAYVMKLDKEITDAAKIQCIPFETGYFEEYMHIYNECFYKMRKELERKPYHFLNSFAQIKEKVKDIHLLVENEEIIGSVACYGNEIDDLIVNKKYQHLGYGKELLLWAIRQIRKRNNDPITLHVAEWNQKAFLLYKKLGFEIVEIEKVL